MIEKPSETIKIAEDQTASDLDGFKERLKRDFGLEEKIDKHGCFELWLGKRKVAVLLPRSFCKFGVFRLPTLDAKKPKVFRVNISEDEEREYEFIKSFVEMLKSKQGESK
ncbi:MAG: hypothetical protein ACTSWZ_02790 [Candidatus Heimdallarchaeaceae archaeon]